jgi:hypothetical protein
MFIATCEGMSHDPISRKFSLYGLFGSLTVSQLPTQLRPIAFYAKLKGTGVHTISLTLAGPDNVPIGDPITTVLDFAAHRYAEIAGYFGGGPLRLAGTHRIELTENGQSIAEPLEIDVVLQGAPPNA